MALNYSYDLTSPTGQVRMLIADARGGDIPVDLTGFPRDTWPCVLADEEIAGRLAIRNGDLLMVAADCLLAMASDAAQMAARIRIGDYQLDESDTATALRTQALTLVAQANAQPAEAIIEPIGTIYQAREQLLRGLLNNSPIWWLP